MTEPLSDGHLNAIRRGIIVSRTGTGVWTPDTLEMLIDEIDRLRAQVADRQAIEAEAKRAAEEADWKAREVKIECDTCRGSGVIGNGMCTTCYGQCWRDALLFKENAT